MRWLLRYCLSRLLPEDRIGPMASKPSGLAVAVCACLAIVSIAAGVYYGGTGRTGLAVIGATMFVLLGGLAFELARRRSV